MKNSSTFIKQVSMGIRILRVKRGWSQETLAELAHLHRNYIGLIERSGVNIGIENLYKIAKVFDLSPGDLLNSCENER